MDVDVFVIVITCVSIAIPITVLFFIMRAQKKRMQLLQSGEPAMAAVVQAWETGMYVNNQPQIGLLLEVRPQSSAPFRVQTQQVLSMLQLPRVQPGAIVPVRYNPNNPAEITIAV